MIKKICPRCHRLMPYGSRYCDECEPIVEAERKQRLASLKKRSGQKYNKEKRNPKMTGFYRSQAWRSLSSAYAQDHGYRCERCGAIANQVHHKQYLSTPEGWARRLDYDNLELLCTKCHNEEHKRFSGKPRKKGEYITPKGYKA